MLAAAAAAATIAYWPSLPGLNTFTYLFDSLVFHLAVFAIVGAAGLALLRQRPAITFLTLGLALFGAATTIAHHVSVSKPLLDAPADLRVLWFNMLNDNPMPAEILIAEVIAAPADLIVLSEAENLHPFLSDLDDAFAQRVGCDDPEPCRMIALSRIPNVSITLREIGITDGDRAAVIELFEEDGAPHATVLALHMNKPWFFGIVEGEMFDIAEMLSAITGPLVVMGDLNAAPWNRGIRHLTGPCALQPSRVPLPTWPSGAGWLGVPIDHVMVREAGLVSLVRWGDDLGSNHSGLLGSVALSVPDPGRPISDECLGALLPEE